MIKVTRNAGCGNSPKSAFVQDFAIAFAGKDFTKLTKWVTDDVELVRPKGKPIIGWEKFYSATDTTKPKSITIHYAIAHGSIGAANGVLSDAKGKETHFAYVLEFSGVAAKQVRRISAYVMK